MTIDTFIQELNEPFRSVTQHIYKYLTEYYPDIQLDLKLGFRSIYFKDKKVICGLNPYSNYVSLLFMFGAYLKDSNGTLEGSGAILRHLKFRSIEYFESKKQLAASFIEQSIDMNK